MNRYKDVEGNFLDFYALPGDRGYVIGWYILEEDDYGRTIDSTVPLNEEDKIAIETTRSFFEEKDLCLPTPQNPFVFENEKQARDCLKQINLKLIAWKNNRPFPDWAQKALDAGWKAPKGWIP